MGKEDHKQEEEKVYKNEKGEDGGIKKKKKRKDRRNEGYTYGMCKKPPVHGPFHA